ncbi:hypothetical protein RJ639_027082 [Escallonia herrerae]|uniref:Peroxiredoxin-like 2A n=1 Tax=Escallonia herrerae TaxID=1293975 RepID=A0AA88X747_9ASTE|nr:hypothetical protein RJ639_027082 [Escallonia herrerae]
MASFSMEDFVGNGVLKKLLPVLLEEGWDDVPTLKIMNAEDMDAIKMTQQQKDALEIRSYLHDRALMQYADKLEASAKGLPEMLNLSSMDFLSQFGMKRGHLARFMDRTSACTSTDPLPPSYSMPARKQRAIPSRSSSIYQNEYVSVNSRKMSMTRNSVGYDVTLEQSMADFKIKDGHIYKGIVAAVPDEPRACGCVQPPPIIDNVASYSTIENISIEKLTPEYKIGMEFGEDKDTSDEGFRVMACIMCRAEAHKLYAKKPIFDSLGIRLCAVLHEHIDSEVKDFWPRYWGGVVLLDKGMEFFKALGGGQLLKDKFISGFLFNSRARANYKRAKAMGIEQNFKGEGEIKGGLFIVGKGKSGIAYQFIERNFGDWAPLAEVVDICARLQNQQQSQVESIRSSLSMQSSQGYD